MIAAGAPSDADYETWRDAARRLIAAGARPEDVAWESGGDLFGSVEAPPVADAPLTAPRAFVEVARKAALHRDAARLPLLYRVLWRLQQNRALMADAADADVVKLNMLAKSVRRDEHKMHAFVRFKEIAGDDGARFVAWFEPQHRILKETADFFVRRFTGMRWSIVTPEASAHWDGAALSFGPGGARNDVPAEDARDDDWRAYYGSMFNPARLKIAAMTREMPKHYWRNLPEAEVIAPLIKGAQARAEDMVAAMATTPRKRPGAAHAQIAPAGPSENEAAIAAHAAAPATLKVLNAALQGCRACPLWRDATQAVPGEGPADRPLLALVGEQSGDQEDLAGRPFVGPAGQLLDRALAAAGIDRREVYLSNAVKHFKHEPRGKKRLHKRPDPNEIDICRFWIGHELALVRPTLTIALGATALRSLNGHAGALEAARGRMLATREGDPLWATNHPSALLRMPDEDARAAAFSRFVRDLKDAHAAALKLKHAARGRG